MQQKRARALRLLWRYRWATCAPGTRSQLQRRVGGATAAMALYLYFCFFSLFLTLPFPRPYCSRDCTTDTGMAD